MLINFSFLINYIILFVNCMCIIRLIIIRFGVFDVDVVFFKEKFIRRKVRLL